MSIAQRWQASYEDIPGAFEDNTDPAFVPRRVGSYETYDAQATWRGLRNWRFTLGLRNLGNRTPPYSNAAGGSTFQGRYDPQYVDPRGRFLYTRVTYAFK